MAGVAATQDVARLVHCCVRRWGADGAQNIFFCEQHQEIKKIHDIANQNIAPAVGIHPQPAGPAGDAIRRSARQASMEMER